jgi:hypothetical protein
MSAWLSAFGAKQTSDEAAAWFDPTLLTHSGHLQQKNGATQTDHCVAFRGAQIPVLMG